MNAENKYKNCNRLRMFISSLREVFDIYIDQGIYKEKMKFKFVLLVLACLAVVQAKLVKKCGTPIYALCAIGNSPQACGISPFCPSRGLKLRNNILGCCCSSNPTTTTRRGELIFLKLY